MKKIVIAVDGYSGCGKSTTAKSVAKKLGYAYIDSGAMYRAVTLYFNRNGVDTSDHFSILKALQGLDIYFEYNFETKQNEIYLNAVNVEDEIRKMYISEQVSRVSALSEVRKAMVAQQKKMGDRKGIVMDGRDIGTNVFPEAELKIFMTADIQVRALRRQKELAEKKQFITLDEVIKNLSERDAIDTSRLENPLRKADDACLLDTTNITIDEQCDFVVDLAEKILQEELVRGNRL